MKKYVILAAVSSIFLFGCFNMTKADEYEISGRVVDSLGNPISSVKVEAKVYQYYKQSSDNESYYDDNDQTDSLGEYNLTIEIIYDENSGPESLEELGGFPLRFTINGSTFERYVNVFNCEKISGNKYHVPDLKVMKNNSMANMQK